MAAAVRGAAAERLTGSPSVTSTSSSIRTPTFHHFGFTSAAGAM